MSIEPTPYIPTYAERLDTFVSEISKISEKDIKGRLSRLSPQQQTFLDKALEIFREAKFSDRSSLESLEKQGGHKTLEKIEKVLKGREAQATKKTKQMFTQVLLGKLAEAKEIHEKRTNPFVGFENLSKEDQLKRLNENGKWEETHFKYGLRGVLAANDKSKAFEENVPEIKRRMDVLFQNFENWTNSYEKLTQEILDPEVKTLLDEQIKLQKSRLSDLKYLNEVSVDFDVIHIMLEAIKAKEAVTTLALEKMPSEDAFKWLSSLRPYLEVKTPAIKLEFLSILNDKRVEPLIRKLYQAVLTGADVPITPEESEVLAKLSKLSDFRPAGQSYFGVVRLWFLQFMTRHVVDKIKFLSDQAQILDDLKKGRKEAPFTDDPLYSLSYQINRALIFQETDSSPLVAKQIDKSTDQLFSVMQAREERQMPTETLPYRLISIRDRLFEIGEMDAKLSLLGQSKEELTPKINRVDKLKAEDDGGKQQAEAVGQVKNEFVEWAQANPRRAELLKEVVAAVEKANTLVELTIVNRNINKFFGDLTDERREVYDGLMDANLITNEGVPNVETQYAFHYTQDLRSVESYEAALLAQRETALSLAIEISLYETAKNTPETYSAIQKVQSDRSEMISMKLKNVEPESSLATAYQRELDDLNEINVLAGRSTTLPFGARIQLELDKRKKQLEALEERIDEIKKRLDESVKTLEGTEIKLEGSRPETAPTLEEDVKSIFSDTTIYPEGDKGRDALDNATTRRTFFYSGEGKNVSMDKKKFSEHEAFLTDWGLAKEKIPALFTLFSGTGQAPIFERATRFFGSLAAASESFVVPITHQYPHLSLVKNDDGNYEIYLINVSDVRKFTTSPEAQGYDIGIIRVLLDGKAIEEGKPFAESVKETAISPPIKLEKGELEKMAKVEIKLGVIPPEAEKMMLELLLDSIPDEDFRKGARSVITSFQETISK